MRSRSVKPTHCESIVASDAPSVPIPRVKIRSGSSAMFSTAPEMMPTMAVAALPCRRIWLFITSDAMMKGVPTRIHRR